MYDLIIIGAGPAGLSAGLYAGRANLKTLILEKLVCGGQILLTENIENYPGFGRVVSSAELIENMEKQARGLGVEIVQDEVKCIGRNGVSWKVSGSDGGSYEAGAIVVAVGSLPKALGIEGESRLLGKGVSYCAVCDGPLYRKKTVVIIGGGDTAVEEALYLSHLAQKVFIIHRRDSFRAAAILVERLKANNKIQPFYSSIVKKIHGANKVEGVALEGVVNKEEETLSCDGVFIYVGRSPDTAFLKNLVEKDEQGHIITDGEMHTNQPGIFAAGDCRKKILRQVVTACSDGATAVNSAQKYLEGLRIHG